MSHRARVFQNRDAILALAEKFGATELRLMGSVARHEDGSGSDIDFLVKMQPGRSLLDRASLVVALEDLLGCPVDVVNERGVKRRFLAHVGPDLLPL